MPRHSKREKQTRLIKREMKLSHDLKETEGHRCHTQMSLLPSHGVSREENNGLVSDIQSYKKEIVYCAEAVKRALKRES